MSPGITVRGRLVRLVGLLYGWRELEGHEQKFLALAFGWKVLLLVRVLFHVTTSSSNLPKRNSCARLAPMRSAVCMAKFPNTNPAPRLDVGKYRSAGGDDAKSPPKLE